MGHFLSDDVTLFFRRPVSRFKGEEVSYQGVSNVFDSLWRNIREKHLISVKVEGTPVIRSSADRVVLACAWSGKQSYELFPVVEYTWKGLIQRIEWTWDMSRRVWKVIHLDWQIHTLEKHEKVDEAPSVKAVLSGNYRRSHHIFDVSCREPQTHVTTSFATNLDNRLEVYKHVREYGINEITVGAFYYSDTIGFDYGTRVTNEQTEKNFVKMVRQEPGALAGCFNMIDSNSVNGLEVSLETGVPNLFIDLFLDEKESNNWTAQVEELQRRVNRARKVLPFPDKTDFGPIGVIYVNIGNIFHVYYSGVFKDSVTSLRQVCEAISKLPIQGIFFEDYQGNYDEESFREVTLFLREYFPHGAYRMLTHVHEKQGIALSCATAAVVAGADGIWAGMTYVAAQVGHVSYAQWHFILLTKQNKMVETFFKFKELLQRARQVHYLSTGAYPPEDCAVLGKNAFTWLHTAFQTIGGHTEYIEKIFSQDKAAITPTVSNNDIFKTRYLELFPEDGVITDSDVELIKNWIDRIIFFGNINVDFNSREFNQVLMGFLKSGRRPSDQELRDSIERCRI
jgi:isopropylmalate/homocitrate/citramalate synthase